MSRMTEFSEQLRAARLARGLSQWDLGVEMGVLQSQVSLMERGDNDPRLSTLQRFAHGVGLRVVLVPIEEPADDAPA